mgnify:CR=1 FL=1
MRILVTNDDGIQSEGIDVLVDALVSLGDVYAVAPEVEASASGHALTLRRPLRIRKVSKQRYGVDGTPTDCVNVAVSQILKTVPDLVVSGINKGWNLGDDVTYSGTVAGALEGVLLGAPALAVSQQRVRGAFDFKQAARIAKHLAGIVLQNGLPPRTFLNVNVPHQRARGVKVTSQAKRNHRTSVAEAFDPRRQAYYWIDEAKLEWEADGSSDYEMVRDGWISITPLQSDWTAYGSIEEVKSLVGCVSPETTPSLIDDG